MPLCVLPENRPDLVNEFKLQFESLLEAHGNLRPDVVIATAGGNTTGIFALRDINMWGHASITSAQVGSPERTWVCFGLGQPTGQKKIPPAVEVNFRLDGYLHPMLTGAYALDESGEKHILHSGFINWQRNIPHRIFQEFMQDRIHNYKGETNPPTRYAQYPVLRIAGWTQFTDWNEGLIPGGRACPENRGPYFHLGKLNTSPSDQLDLLCRIRAFCVLAEIARGRLNANDELALPPLGCAP